MYTGAQTTGKYLLFAFRSRGVLLWSGAVSLENTHSSLGGKGHLQAPAQSRAEDALSIGQSSSEYLRAGRVHSLSGVLF